MGEGEDYRKNVELSVKQAKEAIMLDLKDSQSWYILGNAHLCHYFGNLKSIKELEAALKCYNESEKHAKYKNPDLHFNRAEVLCYLQEYMGALKEYTVAHNIDPTLDANEQGSKITTLVNKFNNLIQNRGKIKPKKLEAMRSSIPTSFKLPPNYGVQKSGVDPEVKSFKEMKPDFNKGSIVSCVLTNIISKSGEIPALFVIMDFTGAFA